MKLVSKLVAGLVAALTITVLTQCGDEASSTSYAGPGSAYTASFDSTNNTFTITMAADVDSAVSLTVNGTYQDLSSGYKFLTVTDATGSNAPSAGDTAVGLEIPGFVFLLKPLGGDNPIIPMVNAGTCPSSDLALNWVNSTSNQDPSVDGNEFFGTFNFTVATGVANLPNDYDLDDFGTAGGGTPMNGTCSNGVMEVSVGGTPQGTMWLTANGGALVQTNNGNVITAMPQQSLTAADFDGDYSGLLFDDNEGSGDKQKAVWVNITGSGTSGTGGEWTDIQAGTKGATGITLGSFNFNNPNTGFVTMVGTASGSGNIACQGATNVVGTGKNMLFCAAQSPDSNSDFYSLLLVSQ